MTPSLPSGMPHPDFASHSMLSRRTVTGLAGAALSIVMPYAGVAGVHSDWREYQQGKNNENAADIRVG